MPRFLWSVLTVVLVIGTASAQASPLYNVTVLGDATYGPPPDAYRKDAAGDITGVTAQSGAVYAFDKTPTSFDTSGRFDALAHGAYTYPSYTSADGAKQGLSFDQFGFLPAPQFTYGNWRRDMSIPVTDFNTHGQAIGFDSRAGLVVSEPDFKFRDDWGTAASYGPLKDKLSNFLPPDTPIVLSLAWKIDDLGRILASGRDKASGVDKVYLLTPSELGTPTPVPEPVTGAVFAVLGCWFAVSCRSRRHGRRLD